MRSAALWEHFRLVSDASDIFVSRLAAAKICHICRRSFVLSLLCRPLAAYHLRNTCFVLVTVMPDGHDLILEPLRSSSGVSCAKSVSILLFGSLIEPFGGLV